MRISLLVCLRRLVAAAIGLVLATNAGAAVAVALRDTHIDSSAPAANFAGAATLSVSSKSTALIGFDFSILPAEVTSSQVLKATLHLWVNKASTNPAGSIRVVPLAKAWQGPAVTFARYPGHLKAPESIQALNGGANHYLQVDVTAHVREFVTKPANNHGFAVMAHTPAVNVQFDSKENDATSHAAMLDITLSTGKSVAVCLNASSPLVCTCTGKLVSRVVGGSCSATSDTGPCNATALGMAKNNPRASCCVCVP